MPRTYLLPFPQLPISLFSPITLTSIHCYDKELLGGVVELGSKDLEQGVVWK